MDMWHSRHLMTGYSREQNSNFSISRRWKELFPSFGHHKKNHVRLHSSTCPSFGSLWEAAVKRMKTHLKRIEASVKLNFEEFETLLVEASFNGNSLLPLPSDDDCVEELTPGHFLLGQPLDLSCPIISLSFI